MYSQTIHENDVESFFQQWFVWRKITDLVCWGPSKDPSFWWKKGAMFTFNLYLRTFQQTPGAVYEGIPFIWGFGDVWGMLSRGMLGFPSIIASVQFPDILLGRRCKFCKHSITLPKTNMFAPEKFGWNMIVSFWHGMFSGDMLVLGNVSLRVCFETLTYFFACMWYNIWAIYNDLSRGHPKWWFNKGTSPKSPNNSGLGIILICPDQLHPPEV